tara:strand:- start:211 stop:1527 length:1317 start_codon:yes stop_codon:yes gene_type:complete
MVFDMDLQIENWGLYTKKVSKYLTLVHDNPYVQELKDDFVERKRKRILDSLDSVHSEWIHGLMVSGVIDSKLISFLNLEFDSNDLIGIFGKYISAKVDVHDIGALLHIFSHENINTIKSTRVISRKFTPTQLKFVTTTAIAWLSLPPAILEIDFAQIYALFEAPDNILENVNDVVYAEHSVGKIVGCKTGGEPIKGFFKKNNLGDFYNCTTVNVVLSTIKSANIKIFNNGKFQMTGIPRPADGISIVKYICNMILDLAGKHPGKIMHKDRVELELKKYKTVMINTCYELGVCVNRESLYNIITKRYNMSAIYDSDGYPGVRIEYYYNTDTTNTEFEGICNCPCKCKGKGNGIGVSNCRKISIAIFQSGSAIIAGGCSDAQPIYKAYNFINVIIGDILDEIYKPETAAHKLKRVRANTIYINTDKIVNKSLYGEFMKCS